MNERLKQVRDSWNETADSDWYQSLRTEEKIGELVKTAIETAETIIVDALS